MNTMTNHIDTERYARCITASQRISWDIDKDVIRGREFDFGMTFLPDGLTCMKGLGFLDEQQTRFLSHIQGRTYANMFGLVERFINAKMLEVSREHWLGDQVALEALVRFSEEELKHQALFRRIESMVAKGMPAGYQFMPMPDDVAVAVLSKSTWSVLGLTLLIELFTQVHYKASIGPNQTISPLYKDVFLYHWREESQHAIMDELEWTREDARMSDSERDGAVTDLIELVGAVDGILQMQASADAAYFMQNTALQLDQQQQAAVESCLLVAYRYQYILSGVEIPHFQQVLFGMVNDEQGRRITDALATLS